MRNALGIMVLTVLAIFILACGPDPTPTSTSAPTATAVPTPTSTPEPAATATPKALKPIAPFPDDPDAALAELPPSETACVMDSGTSITLSELFTTEDVGPEDVTVIVNCISDETLLRLMVTGMAQDTGPLSIATSSCIRAATEQIDLRAALISIAEAAEEEESAADDDIVFPLLMWSCFSENELASAPGETAFAGCALDKMGGTEGVLEVYREGGGPALMELFLTHSLTCASEGNPLANTEWRLVALGNADAPTEVAAGDASAEFTTTTDMTGWTGCNAYGATYSVRDSGLRLDNLTWTEAGCPSRALFQQEQQMQDSLATVERFEVSGEQLTLHSEGGQVLVFERVGK